jgi:hypothetical protein
MSDELTRLVLGIAAQNARLNAKEGTVLMGELESKKTLFKYLAMQANEQELEARCLYYDAMERLEEVKCGSPEEIRDAQCDVDEADAKHKRAACYNMNCIYELGDLIEEYNRYKYFAISKERIHADTFDALSSALSRN